MTTKHIVVVAVAALLLSLPGSAQTASDLLQKGIHAQEAAGDLEGAIAIFRQVVNASSTNKALAAQAQYQLVLCMLQKGDREAASRELGALERNFADMPELVSKARKLIPATSALLPEPWGDRECAQLDIQRAGVSTGEYLYYSADSWAHSADESMLQGATGSRVTWGGPLLQATVFGWELKTANSTRSITAREDRNTMRPFENLIYDGGIGFNSDDDLGDPLAVPFTGPATDLEQSVFLMRRLPLAVGYKTTLPVTSNSYAPSQLELAVAGIETVSTPAGKFNCYKVAFAAIGQTFWIGVEGARPLVKFQSGTVQAELVKVWGPENPVLDSLAAIAKVAGAKIENSRVGPGKSAVATIHLPYIGRLRMTSKNIHTPPAEIAQALQRALAEKTGERHLNPLNDYVVRPGSLRTRSIGGQPALSCLLDYKDGPLTAADTTTLRLRTLFIVWIGTETAIVELQAGLDRGEVATFRWRFDPIVDAIRIP
jgi:hypothetical protein